ncbi:hypothetical protein GQ600_7630 [Phytophthora cactorum]|nr:hypothetical protein GQ600_7630 [Phytophthora cactorum]
MCKSSTGYEQQLVVIDQKTDVLLQEHLDTYPLNEQIGPLNVMAITWSWNVAIFNLPLLFESEARMRNGISLIFGLFFSIFVDSACSSLQYRYRQERHHWSGG